MAGFSNLVRTPGKDAFKKVKEERLTAGRFPDWYVLTTLDQSFGKLAVTGTVPISTVTLLRDQLYGNGLVREARVADQLIKYKRILMGSGAPWLKPRFQIQSLPGYSSADIKWLLEKVKAGQDLNDIIARYYDNKSREAMYRANWADVINVPLTLLVGLLSLGVLGKVNMLGKTGKKVAEAEAQAAQNLVK